MCNKTPARDIIGMRTEEQMLSIREMASIAAGADMVVRYQIDPGHFDHGKCEFFWMQLAPVDSWYRGQYTWTTDVYVKEDGTVEIEGGNGLEELMPPHFTQVATDGAEWYITRWER